MHLQVCFDCCRGSCSVIAGSCLVAQWYLRIPDFFGKRHDSPALSFLGWLALDGLQVMGWCCNWQREGPSVPPCLSWNLGITLKLWHEKKLPTNRPDSFSFFFIPLISEKACPRIHLSSMCFLSVPLISWTFGWKLATEIRTTLNTANVEMGYPSSHNHGSVENNPAEKWNRKRQTTYYWRKIT